MLLTSGEICNSFSKKKIANNASPLLNRRIIMSDKKKKIAFSLIISHGNKTMVGTAGDLSHEVYI